MTATASTPEPTPAEHLRRAQDLLRNAEAAHSYGHHTTSAATAALATAQATTALAGATLALVEVLAPPLRYRLSSEPHTTEGR